MGIHEDQSAFDFQSLLAEETRDLLTGVSHDIDEAKAASVYGAASRLLIATDWSDAAPALTLLKAFRAIVPPTAPVQLVFVVPQEPTEADAANIAVLAEGAGNGDDLRGLDVASFAEVVQEPFDSAVVPTGDPAQLLTEVGGLIVRMHDLVRRLDRREITGEPAESINLGNRAVLASRLEAFDNLSSSA